MTIVVNMYIEGVAILHNIRSAQNVGAIFRTADGAGITKIYLTGYTPAPTDRFGRVQPMIAKTALGAEKTIPWEQCSDILSLLARLQRNGFTCYAVEQDSVAKKYDTVSYADKSAFIFGNEVDGLDKTTLGQADAIIEIPMRGEKESLNVSVAVGIILFKYGEILK